jgi:hypothetical protein
MYFSLIEDLFRKMSKPGASPIHYFLVDVNKNSKYLAKTKQIFRKIYEMVKKERGLRDEEWIFGISDLKNPLEMLDMCKFVDFVFIFCFKIRPYY